MILIIVIYNSKYMNTHHRDTILISLRPDITIDIERESLPEEKFQQHTLRPILKFQNAVIMEYFIAKTASSNIPINVHERSLFVENIIRKDLVLRNQLIGLVAGLFTSEEFAFYLQHVSTLNKRITQLLIKRLQDQF